MPSFNFSAFATGRQPSPLVSGNWQLSASSGGITVADVVDAHTGVTLRSGTLDSRWILEPNPAISPTPMIADSILVCLATTGGEGPLILTALPFTGSVPNSPGNVWLGNFLPSLGFAGVCVQGWSNGETGVVLAAQGMSVVISDIDF
jgi:hypothetical protein